MPIYAYKCGSCGLSKDVLQKMSDAPLSDCPACGVSSFRKQLTAAGFQLKGSGWYATDFKGSGAGASGAAAASAGVATADTGIAASASGSTADAGSSAAPPTAGCATGCACH